MALLSDWYWCKASRAVRERPEDGATDPRTGLRYARTSYHNVQRPTHTDAHEYRGLQENHGITIAVNTVILAIAAILRHGCGFRRIVRTKSVP